MSSLHPSRDVDHEAVASSAFDRLRARLDVSAAGTPEKPEDTTEPKPQGWLSKRPKPTPTAKD